MTSKTGTKKTSRRQHSPEFRAEALALAEKIGISKAAQELGLHSYCTGSLLEMLPSSTLLV
ncbi:hypothetical protein GCM10025791_40800 [Halioxenophilus aromaticivorans]|uniref:Transposase n=1 Tax=Halioxenophilus aromaticivorans TaxID=1306992 RepID=A0AAV3U913_9ALTE